MGRSDDEQLGDRLFLVVNPPTFSTADFHHFATSIFRSHQNAYEPLLEWLIKWLIGMPLG
jgi:hypothetical protein